MRALSIAFIAVSTLGLVACSDSPTTPSQTSDARPTIVMFSVDSPKIGVLQTTTLRWEVADTTSDVRIDPYPGNVPYIGSAQVVPTTAGPIVFTINATNKFGTSQRTVTVTVQ